MENADVTEFDTHDVITRTEDAGIVTLTLNDPSRSANTLTDAFRHALTQQVETLAATLDGVRGVILTSAKKSFFAGGDLTSLVAVSREDSSGFRAEVEQTRGALRRLETLGVPVVCALNGAAVGGGLEIALAAHYRVAVRSANVGFPEVGLGLMPGSGGVVRTVRMLGLQKATDLILDAKMLSADQAHSLGLIDEVVDDPAELAAAARRWIDSAPEPAQPWDRKGFIIPGPSADAIGGALTAALHLRVRRAPYPAPRAVLAAAVEGARVDFRTAETIETRYFVSLATGQVAKNMIQGKFLDLREVTSGTARPAVPATAPVRVLAVIGAGMMGAGLAYQAAKSGIEVRLKDVDMAAAERGKDYARKLVAKAIERGRTDEARGQALLDRITVVDDYTAFDGVDAVIEAVFEHPELKSRTFTEAEPHLPGALLATNTSTLPVTELAESVSRRGDFIGMHFFSPVDKMPLLEIVVGRESTPETVARAFDLGRQLGKTPIVVNDKRGFFTSRVITKFTDEALAMLGEGISAASIEQAGLQAGYPAPPLQLSDELTITLPHTVRQETKAATLAAGEEWVVHPAEPVMERMISEFSRYGRTTGGAFYEWENGKRTRLWPGLAEHFQVTGAEIPFADMVERMLFAEGIEALKCFDEGVITSVADANVGSLLGIGFPGWTGGVIQYINGYPGGLPGFVARAYQLAERYGDRFTPPASVVELSTRATRFEGS
ncbi:3-hydroxyacyl-CoA dehydrogenase NAD-binding domain-containing protein [Nocardia rhamnosiphila]|uniref:3-hydroxyacyl-CoA dehydrogenase NAD-binding domain-containing protein n=1 Tax=Nocardia rhamnosiphila TaxID=426716 RepID=A0ABV2WRE0_9NOCA